MNWAVHQMVMVFGTSLNLTSHYFDDNSEILPTAFVQDSKMNVSIMLCINTENQQKLYLPSDLHTCKYIFIGNEGVKIYEAKLHRPITNYQKKWQVLNDRKILLSIGLNRFMSTNHSYKLKIMVIDT